MSLLCSIDVTRVPLFCIAMKNSLQLNDLKYSWRYAVKITIKIVIYKDDSTYRAIGIIYSIHANFCYKSNSRWYFRIFRSALHFQAVYPVFVISLRNKERSKVKAEIPSGTWKWEIVKTSIQQREQTHTSKIISYVFILSILYNNSTRY